MSYGLFKGTNAPYLLFPHDDKIIHVILFGVASILSMLGAIREWKLTKSQAFIVTLVFGILFSCLSEVMQYYIPRRVPDWLDLFSNLVGLLFGMICYHHNFSGRRITGYR